MNQRTAHRRGQLPRERAKALEALNFAWSPQDERWWDGYRRLLDHREVHGNCDVVLITPRLGRWVQHQRRQQTLGTHKSWRKEMLQKVGFRWRVIGALPRARKRIAMGKAVATRMAIRT